MPTIIPQSSQVMSVPEAAAHLGVSTSKMYEIVRIQGFPCIRIGRRVLVNRKKFEEWIDEMTEKGWYIQ